MTHEALIAELDAADAADDSQPELEVVGATSLAKLRTRIHNLGHEADKLDSLTLHKWCLITDALDKIEDQLGVTA